MITFEARKIHKLMTMTQGEPVLLTLHPVLSRCFLKFDISNAGEPDYDLPNEESSSPAVYPPVSSLTLENREGYTHLITIDASGRSPSTGVTVQDVLRTIHEDLRKPLRSNEWTTGKLSNEARAAVDGAFRERCRERDELAQGLRRIDYLCGRDRLQILPEMLVL